MKTTPLENELQRMRKGYALRGKVARLPAPIREQVCQRLYNGQPGRLILAWLNALPEVQAILNDLFAGKPINAINLCMWRKSGYQDWAARQDRSQRARDIAREACALAGAGSTFAKGASHIVAGHLLEIAETIDEAAGQTGLDAKKAVELARALAALRSSEQQDEKILMERRKLIQKDEQLDLQRQKFQHTTVETILKYLKDERARQIESGTGTNEEKIELMGRHIFRDLWKPRPQPAMNAVPNSVPPEPPVNQ